MKTKRSQEGYVLIDHRNSPGITREFVEANKLDAPAVGAGQVFECATSTCHVCGGDIILNPLRTRIRHFCYAHDAYRCDNCETAVRARGECVPLRKIIDDAFNRLMQGQPVTLTL